ncbi:DUF2155 domain-containing protein [Hyphococcus sp. DH-69]|uniref:DUF2155 domain-containing protein n=1 Tax=Hyphococcus formosus TaxID=3143534 RepID=UPI00398AC03D
MLRLAAIGFLGLVALPASAQNPEDELEALLNGTDATEEESELDALSRNEDDPFAGVIETEEREPVSVTLRALNKITARYTDIEIEMNQIAKFGSLEIQPRTCDKRPPEEFPETTAFLEIFDLEYNSRQSDLKIKEPEIIEDEIETKELEVLPGTPIGEPPVQSEPQEIRGPLPIVTEGPQAEGINIFRGWMFASSPALNALEHPVYDVWVIDCKTKLVEN